jgi:microcystin-dependent protein
MANLPQQNTIVQYLADGITTMYIVPFFTPLEIDGTPDIDVYTQLSTATPNPAADINIWNVAYTFTPYLDPTTGGVITFNPGFIPPSGFAVTIVRDVSASLDAEFSDARNFSGVTLDAALDKLLLIAQQNKSYALDRNLSYIVNTFFPDDTLNANVQIPILQPGQVWLGAIGGVIAATLNQSADTSTLRSELANNQPTTNGAALVGYYDTTNLNPTTVAAQLTLLTEAVVAPFPTGAIIDFGGTTPPAGFLLCNGAAVSRTTYANLFAAIGVLWGAGDGSTTFNVPNLVDRATAGSGGSIFGITNAVGTVGGSINHTMAIGELIGHSHALTGQTGSLNPTFVQSPAGATSFLNGFGAASTQVTGSPTPTPFTIVQPTALVLKIIKI